MPASRRRARLALARLGPGQHEEEVEKARLKAQMAKAALDAVRVEVPSKRELAALTNRAGLSGSLEEALAGADVYIGVSAGTVPEAAVATMAPDCIIAAMANPNPEIHPEVARKYAAVVATGRSDFPNQVNNVLAFPGVFAGALAAAAAAPPSAPPRRPIVRPPRRKIASFAPSSAHSTAEPQRPSASCTPTSRSASTANSSTPTSTRSPAPASSRSPATASPTPKARSSTSSAPRSPSKAAPATTAALSRSGR